MGAPAYHPRALLGVWLYGFMTGVRSCRKLEAACRDQISYLWLTGWQRPDHNTLWRFYKSHRQSMRKLLKRTVQTAVRMDLVELALQAVDGTKVGANASGDRTLDAEGLQRLLRRLEDALRDLEAQSEAGEDAAPVHLPQELCREDGAERAGAPSYGGAFGAWRPQSHQPHRYGRTSDEDSPGDNALLQRAGDGLADADRRRGERYVDHCGRGVPMTPMTILNWLPMLQKAEETTGVRSEMTLADAGYHSGSNLKECALRDQQVVMPETQRRALSHLYHKDRFIYDEQTDSYICPQGQWLRFTRMKRTRGIAVRLYRASGAVCRACPVFGVCTRDGRNGRALEIGPHDTALRRHRRWMRTDEARQSYDRRKGLVEPVFGIIKEQQAARRVLLRGIDNVAAEWGLLATAFNLRTLWRVWRGRATRIWRRNLSPSFAHRSLIGASGALA